MTVLYRTNFPVSAEAVADVFRRSGIRRPVDELDRIQSMIDHANLTITAWDGDRLVYVALVGRTRSDGLLPAHRFRASR